ncbi:pollen-specific leucine-rich repeat extensin-like protein 4 [Neltuma alba]|uniref:pollen-specific leucine-rich repeat extensin-like protein 4 n=1 Tax=Neltuma alba TaxID=207710 RepID=UPI0010A4F432|nr:pollen-specific leucine-rich repeat extensin-like protein 4 [Prosopis alba]
MKDFILNKSKSTPIPYPQLATYILQANNIAPFEPGESKTKVPAFGITQLHKMRIPLPFRPSQKVPQKDKGKQPAVSTSKTQDEAESTAAPSCPWTLIHGEISQGDVSGRASRRNSRAQRDGSLPSTTFSFEDLLHHPPSPPHHEPGPSTSTIPTSPVSTSLSVPSTSPTPSPTLALITVPQPVPSLYIPSLSPLSHLPPLPIPLSIPPVSTPSSSPPYADKKGEKDSDA